MAERPARILVVEDEALLAHALEELMLEFGYEVIGPASSCGKALKLIASEAIDGALLDVNLGKERCDSVAEALAAVSAPFLFATGYSCQSALPTEFRDRPVINKPYQAEELRIALDRLLSASAGRALPRGMVKA